MDDEIWEYGCSYEYSKLYVAERNFLLRTINGPMTEIQPGDKIRVSSFLGEQLFYGSKASPVEIGENFVAIRDFRYVGPEGTYIPVEIGDTLKLGREEAIKLLREMMVREKKGGD